MSSVLKEQSVEKESFITQHTLGAIITATADVDPFEAVTVVDIHGTAHDLDSFNLSFEDGATAKAEYVRMFETIRTKLVERKIVGPTSDKMTVYRTRTNWQELQEGRTRDFKIFMTLTEQGQEMEFNLGELSDSQSIMNKLKNWDVKGVQNTMDYGLE